MTDKTPSLTTDLSTWLLEQRPKLKACDRATVGEVCNTLAQVLGCNLAAVLATSNEATYEEVLRRLVRGIHENALTVHGFAKDLAGR